MKIFLMNVQLCPQVGRPAVAGCAPVLPRCGTSAILWSRGLWSVVSFSAIPPFVSICVHLWLKNFAPWHLCVFALMPFPIRVFRGQKSGELASIHVNPCNCDTCAYLQLVAASCSYLHLIATNCTSCASCNNIFFLIILQLFAPCRSRFALRPAWRIVAMRRPLRFAPFGPNRPKIIHNPPSVVRHPHHVSRFTFHDSRFTFPRRGPWSVVPSRLVRLLTPINT